MTQIQDYFDFLDTDDIRIKGTRIGIESVLYLYIHRGQSPEEIAAWFPTVNLEQVYATILYYLSNRQQIDCYMADWLAFAHTARSMQQRNPPPVVQRLRQLKAKTQPSTVDEAP